MTSEEKEDYWLDLLTEYNNHGMATTGCNCKTCFIVERCRNSISLNDVIKIIRDQPYASDTNVGLRQQWIKDEIERKVRDLK